MTGNSPSRERGRFPVVARTLACAGDERPGWDCSHSTRPGLSFGSLRQQPGLYSATTTAQGAGRDVPYRDPLRACWLCHTGARHLMGRLHVGSGRAVTLALRVETDRTHPEKRGKPHQWCGSKASVPLSGLGSPYEPVPPSNRSAAVAASDLASSLIAVA